MDSEKKVILKVLVGSRAHGLADKDSDSDFRAVYVLSTKDILSLNYKYKGNDWIEGDEDNTAYEIGHFLHLALKCNPTILEVFKAPIVESTEDGLALRELFDYVWNPQDSFNAFIGYGLNQRKKMLDKKDNRPNKYAVAYTRTLINLIDLLEKGTFDLKVSFLEEELRAFKAGQFTLGEVINLTEKLTIMAKTKLDQCKHAPNEEKVNEFLINIRKKYFN